MVSKESHGHSHFPHCCILTGDSHVSALEEYSSVLEKEEREESDASHSVA